MQHARRTLYFFYNKRSKMKHPINNDVFGSKEAAEAARDKYAKRVRETSEAFAIGSFKA